MKPIKTFLSSDLSVVSEYITNAFNSISTTISGVMSAISSTISNIWDAIKTTISSVGSAIWSVVTNAFENVRTSIVTKLNAAKDTISSIFDAIKTTISNVMDNAVNVVKDAVQKLKDAFNFEWKLPHIKLPHFSISGEFSLNPPKAPSFGVEWYKNGAILTKPTAFGYNPSTGNTMVGGEAGNEAIAPIDTLQQYVRSAVSEQNQELISVLEIIADDLHNFREMYSINDNIDEKLISVLNNMRFEINNREFARLVKAV